MCDSHVDEEHAEADVSASTDPKSLVIHVRSGDIFRSKRASGVYGQVSGTNRWLGMKTVYLGPWIMRQFLKPPTCFTVFLE